MACRHGRSSSRRLKHGGPLHCSLSDVLDLGIHVPGLGLLGSFAAGSKGRKEGSWLSSSSSSSFPACTTL